MAPKITKTPAEGTAPDDAVRPGDAVRQYAGKTNLSAVLVDSLRRLDDDKHAVTIHWPRDHAFYPLTEQGHSPLLFIESVRQALSVISYAGLDVPVDYRMSWEFLTSDIASTALRPGPDPATVEVIVTHKIVDRRRLGSVRFAAHAHAVRDGMPLGTARMDYTAHPPVLYKRLRGRSGDAAQAFARALPAPPPIDAALAGRTSERDVVLAPGDAPRRWLLRADTTHPELFDHPHDHVPGMVLLEAAHQAVQADAAPERIIPVSLNATFRRYTELDQPCWIVTEPADTDEHGRRRQTVSGVQEDNVAFTIVITGEPATLREDTVPRAGRVPGAAPPREGDHPRHPRPPDRPGAGHRPAMPTEPPAAPAADAADESRHPATATI